MAATKRLSKELAAVKEKEEISKFFKITKADPSNIFVWEGLLYPSTAPFNEFAFEVKLNFNENHPFKPPTITMVTPIYHPNVDEQGDVCLALINTNNWKPVVQAEQIIKEFAQLIDKPDPNHFLRGDIGEEYTKRNAEFLSKAKGHAEKNAKPK